MVNETECGNDTISPESGLEIPTIPATTLLSERALSNDWLKSEEDETWDYL
jgi:hypothetical protein